MILFSYSTAFWFEVTYGFLLYLQVYKVFVYVFDATFRYMYVYMICVFCVSSTSLYGPGLSIVINIYTCVLVLSLPVF